MQYEPTIAQCGMKLCDNAGPNSFSTGVGSPRSGTMSREPGGERKRQKERKKERKKERVTRDEGWDFSRASPPPSSCCREVVLFSLILYYQLIHPWQCCDILLVSSAWDQCLRPRHGRGASRFRHAPISTTRSLPPKQPRSKMATAKLGLRCRAQCQYRTCRMGRLVALLQVHVR
jgi:hypothetical protein